MGRAAQDYPHRAVLVRSRLAAADHPAAEHGRLTVLTNTGYLPELAETGHALVTRTTGYYTLNFFGVINASRIGGRAETSSMAKCNWTVDLVRS
jgi:hypothetical protein